MLNTTDRRAVLVSVLAAGAVGATAVLPVPAAELPALSAADRRVLDLWRRRRKLYTIQDRFEDELAAARLQPNTNTRERLKHCAQRSDACGYALNEVEDEIDDLVSGSTLALAAATLIAFPQDINEGVEHILRAVLVLVRPALDHELAEDAERVLAQAVGVARIYGPQLAEAMV